MDNAKNEEPSHDELMSLYQFVTRDLLTAAAVDLDWMKSKIRSVLNIAESREDVD